MWWGGKWYRYPSNGGWDRHTHRATQLLLVLRWCFSVAYCDGRAAIARSGSASAIESDCAYDCARGATKTVAAREAAVQRTEQAMECMQSKRNHTHYYYCYCCCYHTHHYCYHYHCHCRGGSGRSAAETTAVHCYYFQ